VNNIKQKHPRLKLMSEGVFVTALLCFEKAFYFICIFSLKDPIKI